MSETRMRTRPVKQPVELPGVEPSKPLTAQPSRPTPKRVKKWSERFLELTPEQQAWHRRRLEAKAAREPKKGKAPEGKGESKGKTEGKAPEGKAEGKAPEGKGESKK